MIRKVLEVVKLLRANCGYRFREWLAAKPVRVGDLIFVDLEQLDRRSRRIALSGGLRVSIERK